VVRYAYVLIYDVCVAIISSGVMFDVRGDKGEVHVIYF